jgi:hypothetical protein
MAGVAGRSGRRPTKYRSMSIDDVLRESIRIVNMYLRDKEIPFKDKAELASRFAVKAIPEKILVDEVKKLSFEERMKLVGEFQRLMDMRKSRNAQKDYNFSAGVVQHQFVKDEEVTPKEDSTLNLVITPEQNEEME